jgi:hypothetical protein
VAGFPSQDKGRGLKRVVGIRTIVRDSFACPVNQRPMTAHQFSEGSLFPIGQNRWSNSPSVLSSTWGINARIKADVPTLGIGKPQFIP